MADGHCTYPLTLDIRAFKQRYASLINLTTYQRSNKRALEYRRAAWAAYRPLAKDQLYDSLDPIMTTIRSPYTNGTSKHTKGGVLYTQAAVVYRPTEHMAIAHALGLFKFSEEDLFEHQIPDRKVRWCITCKAFRPIDVFEKVRHNPSGLAFCCTKCRKDLNRGIWHKVAQ